LSSLETGIVILCMTDLVCGVGS